MLVESERIEDGRTSTRSRYYMLSLSNDAQLPLASIRTHWRIENSVHWVSDVAFGEDDSRVRKGNAAQNLSVLCRLALNMLKRETTSQGGRGSQTQARRMGWRLPTPGTGSVKCDCPVYDGAGSSRKRSLGIFESGG